MLSTLFSATISGIQAIPVEVEVDVSSRGLPGITIVGLPTQVVQESKERVRTAIRNAGFSFRAKKVTINLAPAGIHKHGPAFDLPIALALLHAYGCIPPAPSNKILYYGELSLDGTVKPTRGAFAVGLMAQQKGFAIMASVLHAESLRAIPTLRVIPIHSLRSLTYQPSTPIVSAFNTSTHDTSQMPPRETFPFTYYGQEATLRGLVIAASGQHHLISSGSLGTGKTMLQEACRQLVPPLSQDHRLETSAIYSAAGIPLPHHLMYYPPFQSGQHTHSSSVLFGGGKQHTLGLATLSHRGVFVLDELPRFQKSHLTTIQTLLESRIITSIDNDQPYTLPAHFSLFATMNPCPCGKITGCTCSANMKRRYLAAVPEPLLDRIDLFTTTNSFVSTDVQRKPIDLQIIALQVEKATQLQRDRYKKSPLTSNGDLQSKDIQEFCILTPQAHQLLEKYTEAFQLSARRYVILHRVARTIADLEGKNTIDENHVAETIQYCVREKP